MLKKLRVRLSKVQWLVSLRDFVYSLFYPFFFHMNRMPHYQVYSIVESSKKIANHEMSLSRFGDGEIRWLLNVPVTHSFQKNDRLLSKRLLEILTDKHKEGFDISLPALPTRKSGYRLGEQIAWRAFWVRYGNRLRPLIDTDKIYQNTFVTRPYLSYKPKYRHRSGDVFENLKKCWEKKVVLVVEGKYTRFGIGDDLLINASEIKRLICPATNAFESYDQILRETLKISRNYSQQELVILVALGPTATVLCHDISEHGYQAIDIGHTDIEYSWYDAGARKKESVSGKYVNEANRRLVGDLQPEDREIYQRQIIKSI